MCDQCGCGKKGKVVIDDGKRPRARRRSAGPAHDHPHPHDHDPGHGHPHDQGVESPHRVVDVNRSVLSENQRRAERNRGWFRARKLAVVNVLSAPGSGKTTLLEQTAVALGKKLRMGVIVGDLATDNDARRLRAKGIPVVQVATGTLCHLDADMVARAAEKLDLDALDLLVIENVGNLVCPAAFDLGERLRVVLLSVTEGEDKPLKYPPIFGSAHVLVINKTDLAAAVGFDRAETLANMRRVAPRATVLEVSARTGKGMESWLALLKQTSRLAIGVEPAT